MKRQNSWQKEKRKTISNQTLIKSHNNTNALLFNISLHSGGSIPYVRFSRNEIFISDGLGTVFHSTPYYKTPALYPYISINEFRRRPRYRVTGNKNFAEWNFEWKSFPSFAYDFLFAAPSGDGWSQQVGRYLWGCPVRIKMWGIKCGKIIPFTIVRRGMNKYVEFLQRYMRFCDGSGEKNVSGENREMCEVYYFLERIFD